MILTKNFDTAVDVKITGGISWEEFPSDMQRNAEKLAENLQVIRNAVGTGITVTSGYRPVVKNSSLNGSSKTSQHLHGEAWDFVVNGYSKEQLDDLFAELVVGGIRLPNACSQIIRESDGRGGEWIHMGLKTERWIEMEKLRIVSPSATDWEVVKAKKRLVACECLVTRDGEHFQLVSNKLYSDFS